MSALYIMRYVGHASDGFGSVYIGRGKIVGVDVTNIRYQGSYEEANGRLKANITMKAPPGGSQLVTGQKLPSGQTVPLTADWPADFANGKPQQLSVMGQPIQVMFEKIGDIP